MTDSKQFHIDGLMRSMDPNACPNCARREALVPFDTPEEATVLNRPGLRIRQECDQCGHLVQSMFVFAHHKEDPHNA